MCKSFGCFWAPRPSLGQKCRARRSHCCVYHKLVWSNRRHWNRCDIHIFQLRFRCSSRSSTAAKFRILTQTIGSMLCFRLRCGGQERARRLRYRSYLMADHSSIPTVKIDWEQLAQLHFLNRHSRKCHSRSQIDLNPDQNRYSSAKFLEASCMALFYEFSTRCSKKDRTPFWMWTSSAGSGLAGWKLPQLEFVCLSLMWFP